MSKWKLLCPLTRGRGIGIGILGQAKANPCRDVLLAIHYPSRHCQPAIGHPLKRIRVEKGDVVSSRPSADRSSRSSLVIEFSKPGSECLSAQRHRGSCVGIRDSSPMASMGRKPGLKVRMAEETSHGSGGRNRPRPQKRAKKRQSGSLGYESFRVRECPPCCLENGEQAPSLRSVDRGT